MKTLRLLIPLALLAATAAAQTKPATKAKQPAAKPAATAQTQTAPSKADVQPTRLEVAGPISDEFFNHFTLPQATGAAPEGYGFTPQQAIPVGAYAGDLSDQKKISAELGRFLRTYLWADGSAPVFTSRRSAMIDAVNYDIFTVTKQGGTDTLTLYLDMYKSAPVYTPKGFTFYSKEQLVNELAPIVQMVRGYDATADKYADPAAKALSFKIVNQLSQNVGIDYLLDQSIIGPVFNDTGMDLDLKAYLIRSFLSHSFQYQVEGQPKPQEKAFNMMLDDYQAAIKKHPNIFAKGVMPGLVKK